MAWPRGSTDSAVTAARGVGIRQNGTGDVDTVELGGVRLHVVQAYPGIPGEVDRVGRALARIDPAVVLGDLDIDDALRVRETLAKRGRRFSPGFVDALFWQEAARRFAPGPEPPEHPLVAAARLARDRQATFIPLRPPAHQPGWLARMRARRAVANLTGHLAPEFPLAFARAMGAARVWDARSEVEAAKKRLTKALTEGRAPVVAVVQAHRMAPFMEHVQTQGWIPP